MEANDASLGSGDATTRAQELRASLGARQDAETLLAEASRVRQEAASAADAMVGEAQELSGQLVAESRRSAEQIEAEARERADGVVARARIEAEEIAERARATADAIRTAAENDIEEHRRRVRAEVTSQVTRELTEQHELAEARAREKAEAMISDLEAAVRILGVSLEGGLANVTELLSSLDALRATTDTSGPSGPSGPTAPRDVLRDAIPAYDGGSTSAPAAAVPAPSSQFGTEVEEPEADPDRPRSATEAFLSSSSLEIEQSSRELRDLQHPEEARRRRSEESRRAAQRREVDEALADEDPEPEPADGTRPLGWLFRTAQ
jgi:hypothetical protein